MPVWRLVGFALVGLGAHGSGFLINCLFDLPFDRHDVSKAHFPLVSGKLRERDAWFAALIGEFLTFALAAYLGTNHPFAILAYLGFTVFGTLYNYKCKVSYLGPIWISLSFACIPLYAWLAVGPATPTLWFIVSYAFLLMLAQISIEGWWKDLGCKGEVNLLRRLGASVTPQGEYHTPTTVYALALGLRMATATLAILWAFTPWWWGIVVFAVAMLSAMSMLNVVEPGQRSKRQVLTTMGIAEILAYWTLILALAPNLGPWWTIGLFAGPVAYYVATNLFFWGRGHALGPAV